MTSGVTNVLTSDVNECEKENECVFECKNTEGSYECICEDGYYLNPDHRTCTGESRTERERERERERENVQTNNLG